MQFSSFTPFGLARFSSRTPTAQSVLESIRENTGGNFKVGGYHDAKYYALAMSVARLLATAARVGSQEAPSNCIEMLPALEELYQTTAPIGASLQERQDAVAVAMRIILSTAQQSIEAALTLALGSDFVSLKTQTAAAATLFPANPAASVVGLYVRPETQRKLAILSDPVTSLGTPVTVAYTVRRDGYEPFIVGDRVMVSPETISQAERVLVTGTGTGTFTATFTRAHSAGDHVSTAPWPLWVSTKRHSNVVVTTAAVGNPNKRRLIHNVMRRYVRLVSTWDITNNAVDPFTLDVSKMDEALFNA